MSFLRVIALQSRGLCLVDIFGAVNIDFLKTKDTLFPMVYNMIGPFFLYQYGPNPMDYCFTPVIGKKINDLHKQNLACANHFASVFETWTEIS